MSRGLVIFQSPDGYVLLSISILSLSFIDAFQVMMCVMMASRGLVLSHPVGNTSGRMTVLSSITGGHVWCYLRHLVLYFRCVSNSELFTFMQKTWFVIMNLWRMLCNNLWLVYFWTRLHVSLLYKCRSCDVSDLPGPTRQRWQVTSILLLNDQEEWFRQ
jgi:hypothetical protein